MLWGTTAHFTLPKALANSLIEIRHGDVTEENTIIRASQATADRKSLVHVIKAGIKVKKSERPIGMSIS
jgi:hypothetical protein